MKPARRSYLLCARRKTASAPNASGGFCVSVDKDRRTVQPRRIAADVAISCKRTGGIVTDGSVRREG
jgi:hypothetical protein